MDPTPRSDVLVVGVGLEQAIAATVRTCPSQCSRRSPRCRHGWPHVGPTESALRAFADDLDDATGDLIVATLILGARRRGPGLARVLAAVADSVAEEVAMRRKVEAERAKPRTTARAVTLITLGVVASVRSTAPTSRPTAPARSAGPRRDHARVRRGAGMDARPDPDQTRTAIPRQPSDGAATGDPPRLPRTPTYQVDWG